MHHFAVGDTCYSWSRRRPYIIRTEKEIVAKDNSCSLKRKEDPSAAYFQCHTDITVPYGRVRRNKCSDKRRETHYTN